MFKNNIALLYSFYSLRWCTRKCNIRNNRNKITRFVRRLYILIIVLGMLKSRICNMKNSSFAQTTPGEARTSLSAYIKSNLSGLAVETEICKRM